LLAEKDLRIERLVRELKNWQDRLPPLVERFRQRNAEAGELEQELDAARERIAALEAMVGTEQTRVEPLDSDALADGMDASNDPIDRESAEDDVDDEFEIAAEDEDVDEREEDDEAASDDISNADQVDFGNDGGAHDDLKLIKGVGPAIEKTLKEMGICRFNQIAEMSEYDIDRIARRLRGFRSRIYREDWIGQARDLHGQKVSGQL